MKRNKNGIWVLTDEEMHNIRKVFEFADLENALTKEEILLEIKMDEIYFDNFKKEMDQISFSDFEEWTEIMEAEFPEGDSV